MRGACRRPKEENGKAPADTGEEKSMAMRACAVHAAATHAMPCAARQKSKGARAVT